MTKQLVAIEPAKLGEVWPKIREEVATIEAPEELIPEDVYLACKTNSAVLFLLMEGEKRVGWTVLRLIAPDLHIWQLRADAGYDVLTEFREPLMAVARQAGAQKITYGSTRKAWATVAPKHGFKMRMIVYECPVDTINNNEVAK